MPADQPFTAAELEAGATMHAGLWALPAPRDGDYDMARAVLAAVAPLIAARVQAEEREAIARAIEPHAGSELVAPAAHRAYRHSARIARAHRTTPTEGAPDAAAR